MHFIEKRYLCNAKVTFVCQWKNSNNLFFEMHMLMRNNCSNNWKIDSIDFSSSNVHKWRWFWQHRQFVVFRLKIFFNLSLLSMSYYFRNLILEWFLFKRFLWRFVFMKVLFYIKIFKDFCHILFYMEKIFLVHLMVFLETFHEHIEKN